MRQASRRRRVAPVESCVAVIWVLSHGWSDAVMSVRWARHLSTAPIDLLPCEESVLYHVRQRVWANGSVRQWW